MATTTPYRVTMCGGADFTTERTVFSSDSRYLICCCGHDVNVLSIASGDCLHKLKGHTNSVTSIAINSQNHLQLFTSSLDGTVKQWDYNDGILLKTYKIGKPVFALYSPVKSKRIFILLQETIGSQTFKPAKKGTKATYCLKSISLPKSTDHIVPVGATTSPSVLWGIDKQQKKIAFGVDCQYVVAVQGHNIYINFFQNTEESKKNRFVHNSRFTCVACHPTEYCIATGDTIGQLTLWRNFDGTERELSKHKNQWHALRLEDVCFTTGGSYIFTVGHECTVVQWQFTTNSKNFLPRLGAPIHQVSCSPDNTMIATSHKDNAVHVICNKEVVQTFQGLTRAFLPQLGKAPTPTGLILDPRTKAVVLNGKPGHLQFYAMHTDKQLYNLDIVCQNYVSSANLDKPIIHTEVENAAFDSHGDWLATVERRDDGETSMEMRLKFWQWVPEKQSFVLNTCVELPHQAKVTDLCMRPYNNQLDSAPMAVTASRDNKFKIWTLVDDTDIYRKNECWNCQSVGFYHDLPADRAAFSTDGSLLAVAFQQAITLWDPDLNDLKTVLCQPPLSGNNVRCLHFGSGSSSQYLVAMTTETLTVWNLLTCSVHWMVNQHIVCLAKDPSTEYFAAIAEESEVFIFKASEQIPAYTYKTGKSFVTAAIFVPHVKEHLCSSDALPWQQKSQLYLLDDRQQVLTIRSEEESLDLERQNSAKLSDIQGNLLQTPFSVLLAKKEQEKAMKTLGAVLHGTPSAAAVREMLDTPAHVLPPVSSLCSSFMKTLLVSKSPRNESEDASDEDSSDDQNTDSDDSDMDVDEVPREHAPQTDQSQTAETQELTLVTRDPVDVKRLSKASHSRFSWLRGYFNEVK